MKKGIVYTMAALLAATMAYTAAGCSKTGNQPEEVNTVMTKKTEEEETIPSAGAGKAELMAETTTEPFETDVQEETTSSKGTESESGTSGIEKPAAASTQTQQQATSQPAATKPTAAPTQPAATKPTAAPTQPATTKPTAAPTQPAATKPTAAPTQPATTKPTTAPTQPAATKPTTAPTEQQTTAAVKSIYEYPYDIDAIRAELIAYGESLGYIHYTTKPDGTAITPDNSSWFCPQGAGIGMNSTILEKNLKEMVTYDPKDMCEGDPIIVFTIYIESNGNGEYNFYVLVG